MTPTILITGGTRGLGMAGARAAVARGARVLVTGRERERTAQAAAAIGAEPLAVDLTSLSAVRSAAAGLPHIDAVACNAGLQLPGALQLTEDGFEETFQVNHLAHVVLVDALLDREDAPARIVFIGSGTHDPDQRTGLPPAAEVPVATMARGELGSDRNAGRRRYSTSKLLSTAVTGAYARDRTDVHFGCLDPGLIITTGLTRNYPPLVQRATKALARPVGLLPFASTEERSGAALAALLLAEPAPAASGVVLDHHRRPAKISTRAADPVFQDEALLETRRLAAASSVAA